MAVLACGSNRARKAGVRGCCCRYFRRLQRRYAAAEGEGAAADQAPGNPAPDESTKAERQAAALDVPITCINLLRCSMQVRPRAQACSALPGIMMDVTSFVCSNEKRINCWWTRARDERFMGPNCNSDPTMHMYAGQTQLRPEFTQDEVCCAEGAALRVLCTPTLIEIQLSPGKA